MGVIMCSSVGLYFLIIIMLHYCKSTTVVPVPTTTIVSAELTHYTADCCTICFNHTADARLMACQHTLCQECARRIGQRCPFCRATIVETIEV